MINGFHIEPTNICTLKCPGCARTRFIDQWPQHWHNHSLDAKQLLQFLDVDLSDKIINLCGNYGDPIYHPDFINFVKTIKETNTNLVITTNGSYKTKEWWKELVSLLTVNDWIIFSIDGIPENFTEYRKNADWKSIEIGLSVVGAANIKSTWKYIPFNFNENNIDQAKKIASNFGITNFFVDPSDRYDDITANLMPSTVEFVGQKFKSQQQWKNNKSVFEMSPLCNDNKSHYITAEGFYSPCAYIADHRFYYKNTFGKHKKQYDIRSTTITEILARPAVIEFYNTLEQNSVCQYTCSKIN